jgi:hypothetical protein
VISVCCHYNDEALLDKYLRASLEGQGGHELLLRSGYPSMVGAYLDMEGEAQSDLCVFVHQDVVLPAPWIDRFLSQVDDITQKDPSWAVIGVFGTDLIVGQRGLQQAYFGNVRDTFEYRACNVHALPRAVASLDAMLVAKQPARTSHVPSGQPWHPNLPSFTFDPDVPGFHGYTEEICIRARILGRGVWVANSYTEHWCKHTNLSEEPTYAAARAYVQKKWPGVRPIVTTCEIW